MAGPAVWRALVEYDGTDYFGFQVQADVPTIQGELESALGRLAGGPVRVIGAGRTDTGVHACGQVISFPLRWSGEPERLQRALNAILPDGIAILALEEAPEGFHPRFSAVSRTYVYRVWNAPWRSPLRRRFSAHLEQPLDVAAMSRAAEAILGTHDFGGFGHPPQGENRVRTVYRVEWGGHGHELEFWITANAFLRKMVRRLVGTMLEIGRGMRPPEEMAELLEKPDISRAGPPAPSQGLCLVRVEYPPEFAFEAPEREANPGAWCCQTERGR